MREGDKDINKKLEAYSSEVNPDEIWAAIEPGVDAVNAERKRKKRGFFWLFFGGVLLLAATLTAYGVYGFAEQNESSEPVTEVIPTRKNAAVETEKARTETSTAEVTRQISDDPTTAVLNTTGVAKGAQEDNIAIAEEGKPGAQEKAIDERNISQKTTIAAENIDLNTDDFLPTETAENQSTESAINVQENVTTDLKIGLPSDEQKDNTAEIFTDADESTDPQAEKQPILLEPEIPDEKETPIAEAPAAEEDDRRSRKYHEFSVGTYAGYSIFDRTLSAKNDSTTTTDLLRQRREEETLLETMTYGLDVKYKLKSGFGIAVGGQFTQITERFNRLQTLTETDSIEGIKIITVLPNGDTTRILGQVPITRTTRSEKEYFNRYRLLDIPLTVGYEGGRDGWTFGATAGVLVNLSLTTRGQIPNGEAEFLNLDADQERVFKNKIGLSYTFGGFAAYEIAENLQISLAPTVRILPASFTVDDYVLDQKYTLIGVRLGARYLFR